METIAVYLVKSCALIALFYVAYFFLLRKETFFRSNRWYLLLGLVTAVILPLVTFKKIIWIDPLPQHLDWENGPLVMAPVVEESFDINWTLVIGVVYGIGLAAFLFGFLLDFYCLRKALRGKTVFRQSDYRFVDTSENIAPFSYFNYIVYNSSLYSDAELANIIEHEKVHSSQNHTVDVLFGRLFCIVFWFNPFVWLYKKAMLQNLEFIADSEATKNIEDKKSYQITLLKVTAHENCVDISNHFYQSLIKKRIVMLNKNQSKKRNSWKYSLIVPALAAFLFYFQVNVVAQEREVTESMLKNETSFVIDKNTSDAELKQEAERVRKNHGVTLKFSKVKRNSQGEITAIKATFKDEKGKKGTTQVNGDEPIQPFRFYKKESGALGFRHGRSNDVRVVTARRNSGTGAGDDVAIPFDDDFDVAVDIDMDIEAPEIPETPNAFESPEVPSAPNAKIFRNSKSIVVKENNGKRTVIIDGKVVADVDVEKIMAEVGPVFANCDDILKKNGSYSYSYSDNGEKALFTGADRIAEEALEKAYAQLEKSAPHMEKQLAQIDRQRQEIDRQYATHPKHRDELKQARADLAEARKDMKEAIDDLRKSREEMRVELAKERAKNKK